MALWRRWWLLASVSILVGVALGSFAAPGSASTAQLTDVVVPPDAGCGKYFPEEYCPPGTGTALVYRGGREANRVRLGAGGAAGIGVSDRGAVIQAGRGCSRVSRHRVSCSVPQTGVYVATGRGADRVVSGLSLGAGRVLEGPTGLIVDGGAGNDVLVTGPRGDLLYGGAGADVLRGRGGGDRLYDSSPRRPLRRGDPSPFAQGASLPLARVGRSRDVFDGGRGGDTISYEGRAGGVRVNLATRDAVGGARRERDSVRGIEDALGGGGGDRLAGDRRANRLDGGQGDDRILGRGGSDIIQDTSGANVVGAGPGNDDITINRFASPLDQDPERVLCGPGADRVSPVLPSDFLNDDCEDLFLVPGERSRLGFIRSLLPLRQGSPPSVLSTNFRCTDFGLGLAPCRLGFELRVDGPARRRGTAPPQGTLLGSQSHTVAVGEERALGLDVSPAGLATLRRHRALRVSVSITDSSPQPRPPGPPGVAGSQGSIAQSPPPAPVGYLTLLRSP